MSDEKKNPLIGAFRAPVPGTAPPTSIKGEESTPTKAEEAKKPTELPKVPADGKAVQEATSAKNGEAKKPAEPPKSPTDGKAEQEVTPAETGEAKKPVEPPKSPTDGKAKQEATPAKTEEAKKPAEPSKVPADSEVVQEAPAKNGEAKKPAGPAKAPTEPEKTGKPAEPPKAPADEKPMQDTAPAKSEGELPKDLHIPLTKVGQSESVMMLNLTEIHKFEGHPFSVRDDKDMWELAESIKQFGVLEPAVVIPRKEGGYEMVSGHRRQRACQLAGLTSMPVIVRNLDRDESIISMVDANLKRENISPMERARAYDMKLEAMKRKTGRRSKADVLAGEKPKQALEVLAEQAGESVSTIKRIRNLVNLEPELQDMVENKVLPVNTASDISYLKPEEQKELADAMKREDKVPSGTQAAALKEASKAGTLTTENIKKVVAPSKKEIDPELKVTFTNDELRSYFPDKQTTVGDVKRVVFEALTLRTRALERQAKKEAEKGAPIQKPMAKQR